MALRREFINLILYSVGEFVFVPLSSFFKTAGTAASSLYVRGDKENKEEADKIVEDLELSCSKKVKVQIYTIGITL